MASPGTPWCRARSISTAATTTTTTSPAVASNRGSGPLVLVSGPGTGGGGGENGGGAVGGGGGSGGGRRWKGAHGGSWWVGRSITTRQPDPSQARRCGCRRRAGRRSSGRWPGRVRIRFRPVPGRPRWKRSKTRSRCSTGIPGPRSSTSRRTSSPSRWARSATGASGGDAFRALSTRLTSSWCRRSPSPGQGEILRLHGDGHFLVRRGEVELALDVAEQGGDLHRRALERVGPTLEPGEVEQLRHHPAQPLGLAQHLAQRLVVGLGDAVDDVLEVGPERGDRRAEVVTDRGDELPPLLLHRLELCGHRVEAAGEVTDLVPRRRSDPGGVVAGGHPAGGFGHLAQRRSDPVGEDLHDRQGEHHRDDRPEPDGNTQGEPQLTDDGADRDGGDDHRRELELDRAQPVERSHQGVPRA